MVDDVVDMCGGGGGLLLIEGGGGVGWGGVDLGVNAFTVVVVGGEDDD